MPLTMLKNYYLIHKTGMLVNGYLIQKNGLFMLRDTNGRQILVIGWVAT